jgi:hypothetical protein
MANGGYWTSPEEWRRVESPLLALDGMLSDFADEFGVHVTKNHKDWPERSIAWGSAIPKLIQLYLANEKELTFNLWLCASQNRGLKRYWKQQFLVKEQPLSEFRDALPSLLRMGRERLNVLTERDLEFVTNLSV